MIWGLNVWDIAILAAFLVSILTVGFIVSRSVHKEADFYLGGRKLGRGLQFFLQFGNSTDAASRGTAPAFSWRGPGGFGARWA